LAIEENGISAVEAMLTSVYWMYRNVYWCHENRGFMAAVKFAFQSLMELDGMTFNDYKLAVYGRSDWDALLYLHKRLAVVAGKQGLYNTLDSLAAYRGFGHERVFSLGADWTRNSDVYHRLIASVSNDLIRNLIAGVRDLMPRSIECRPGEIL